MVAQKKKLTKEQKRVLIAKDALAQLMLGKIKVKQNTGFVVFAERAIEKIKRAVLKDSSIELKKLLPKVVDDCTVCAVGALFLSHVRNFNNFRAKRATTTNGIVDSVCPREYHNGYGHVKDGTNKVLKYFDIDNLILIEKAFEGWWSDYDYVNTHQYIIDYPNSRTRLKVILKNIIRNNGTFVPEFISGTETVY